MGHPLPKDLSPQSLANEVRIAEAGNTKAWSNPVEEKPLTPRALEIVDEMLA